MSNGIGLPEHNYVHIKNECTKKIKSKDLIVDIHIASSRKQIVAIATQNGTGSLNQPSAAGPNANEVVVGVYSVFNEQNFDKTFDLSVTCEKLATLKQAMKP